ncbi:MAG: NADH-quinone oxidoreductase subunit NuoK [Pirellulaceae bacterium]
MSETALLQNYLLVGSILFGLGLTGFLIRRNLIVMFLCAEMMLQGVSLSLIAWGRYHNDWSGQMLVIFIITVAACEAGIALALVLALCRKSGSLDIVNWQNVREEGRMPYIDQEVPAEAVESEVWPTLTPAGIEPATDQQELYRSNV